MATKSEVIIVGAGVSGCSIAYRLGHLGISSFGLPGVKFGIH